MEFCPVDSPVTALMDFGQPVFKKAFDVRQHSILGSIPDGSRRSAFILAEERELSGFAEP